MGKGLLVSFLLSLPVSRVVSLKLSRESDASGKLEIDLGLTKATTNEHVAEGQATVALIMLKHLLVTYQGRHFLYIKKQYDLVWCDKKSRAVYRESLKVKGVN